MTNLPPLWQHQKEAIEKAGSKFSLFFDPGCGKTRTAIELYKKAKSKKRKTLVLAPLNVCRNWEVEIEEYLQEEYQSFLVAGQPKKKKIKTLEAFRDSKSRHHKFLICNIETMRGAQYKELIVESGVDFIIIDESHNFKSYNSQQTKGMLQILAYLRPEYLYLLTGTPAPQGEIDLWSTFVMMERTNDNFFIWRKKHFEDKNESRRGFGGYFPNYKVRKSSQKYFQAELNAISMTARKDESIDLPPYVRTNLYAEMGPEQARHYANMKDFLFAVDGSGNELTAANFLSRTLRLQQILAGWLGEIPVKDNRRLKALDAAINMIDDSESTKAQFIIWTIFKPTYQELAQYLDDRNIRYGFITGENSADDRFDAMNAFQAGELRALIAHPKAGGVGVNLTAASWSIHYTRSFSLVDDLQAEARNYRGGSNRHKRITRLDIITPKTIDEDIAKALKEKKTVQEFIMGVRKEREQLAA